MKKSSFHIPLNIQHLGAVNDASINLRPLTVFVGENSTGKTYTAYLISYIFSKYACSEYLKLLESQNSSIKFDELESLITDLEKNGVATFDLKKFIKNNSEEYFKTICKTIVPKNFKYFLASDTELFDKIKVDLDLNFIKDVQCSHLSPHFLSFNIEYCENCKHKSDCKSPKLMEIDKDNLIIKFEINKDCIEYQETRSKIYATILELMHRSIFNEVYFLGAERTGMALFYHTAIKREMQEKTENEAEFDDNSDESIEEEIKILFSKPVYELFDYVKGIFYPRCDDIRDRKRENEKEINNYLKFANILENQILGGNIAVEKYEEDTVKKLMFNYHTLNGTPLNMTISSSSVKGLSPLILYLKYFIEPNELIIIDEPEINLHPKAQVQLIELLAMLANSKVNIIITTHSPYIIDHLINLMKASDCNDKSEVAKKFYLGDEDAFIDKDNVSAYLFENNSAIDILSEEGEINWKTFSKISEDITDLYFELDDYYAL